MNLQVLGLGAVTPLGLTAASTCAALRANLSAYEASGLFHQSFNPGIGGSLDPIRLARLPFPTATREGDDRSRMLLAAASAVQEALAQVDAPPQRCALIVGTREPERAHPDFDGLGRGWIEGIEAALGLRFHSSSMVIERGHISAIVGMQAARQLLCDRCVDVCVVGGVDSLCSSYDLDRFVLDWRLLSSTVSKGFVPGEGAAFVAVGITGTAGRHKLPVCVAGIGLASEAQESCQTSEGHPTGRGLQRALEAALEDSCLPESSIQLRLSDLNGESYRIDDALLASTRFYKTYRKHLDLWHPASGVGDLGAASGALLIVQGCYALSNSLAAGSVAMCESAADSAERAACVLSL